MPTKLIDEVALVIKANARRRLRGTYALSKQRFGVTEPDLCQELMDGQSSHCTETAHEVILADPNS